jgi:nucleoside-diphosphate-sugar epimerase
MLPNLLRKLDNSGLKRLVCFSSTSIFTKVTSNNTYEREIVSKLVAAEAEIEQICQDRGINFTILRPTLIYGLGIDKNISSLYKFIRKLSFFPLYPPADGLRQPVHADDLARAAIDILNNSKTYNKFYNLGGGEKLPYNEMVGRLFDLLGKRRNLIYSKFLPPILDMAGKIIGSGINSSIATRMNIDIIFDDESATEDFNYSGRKYISRGLEDFPFIN